MTACWIFITGHFFGCQCWL
uniref:Uncharacterized protein n=1 Tax=Anguilla anguilla TaxID=7936 RepID=A0A0E9U5Y6_ANGAN